MLSLESSDPRCAAASVFNDAIHTKRERERDKEKKGTCSFCRVYNLIHYTFKCFLRGSEVPRMSLSDELMMHAHFFLQASEDVRW